MTDGAAEDEPELPEVVQKVMKTASKRKWKDLAKERIEDTKPTIPLGKRFWPLSDEEKDAIAKLFANEAVRRLVTSLRSRDDEAAIEVVDAAYWVKGCSSLGLHRCAVLVGVGGGKGEKSEYCLVDVKEAVATVAPEVRKRRCPTTMPSAWSRVHGICRQP